MLSAWEFWIDRGGTFTDVIAKAPDGRTLIEKLLSENPGQYEDAAGEAIARILAREGKGSVACVKMGTTIATNALLERKGAPTLLVITEGLADAPRIGWQTRPDIFARKIVLPEPLYADVVEARERVAAEGEVLKPLDEEKLGADLAAAYARGLRAAAIVFMHGWRFTDHEKRAAEIARELGFTQISVSHQTAPLVKLIGRADTCIVDAYLSPILRDYVEKTSAALQGAKLLFMQSNGGLVEARAFRGKDAVLSGPAGGVAGMVAAGKSAGFEKLIGFDMGGTSTDVSHYAGAFERTNETVVAGVRLRAPMLAIETVAAGGGSICRFDGQRLRVGPESAGADPGPACYRKGGPLTITDCNVVLGKIQPAHFPPVFGQHGDQPIDPDAARARLQDIAAAIAKSGGADIGIEDLAEGFIAIAVETMAAAIKSISIARGFDLADYALVAFGGAGGQHACLVADALGIGAIVLHPLAGVLSAYGIGRASLRSLRQETSGLPLTIENWPEIISRLHALADVAKADLIAQGAPIDSVETTFSLDLKYQGADAPLTLPLAASAVEAQAALHAEHARRFGYAAPAEAVFVETLSVEAAETTAAAEAKFTPPYAPASSSTHISLRAEGRTHKTPVLDRAALVGRGEISGPALIRETGATTIVEPGWRARLDARGNLVLTRTQAAEREQKDATALDPIRLELFNNRFMAIAELMGATLQATAASVNIKERLDFSCALFDAEGGLIANAPHIPVHLGSMSDSVRAVIAARGGNLASGDAIMLNAPMRGGTHLPDITLISPVFLDGDEAPAFFVAARGHHADIGGLTPGSMPPHSRTLEEEGVLIENFSLVENGKLREAEARSLFASGRYPARNVGQNIADLKAQLAACAKGAAELKSLACHYGASAVLAYTKHIQANAEASVRAVIARLKDGEFLNRLDDGSEIRVAIRVDHAARTARIDFAGTSAQHPGNMNAPLAITRAATLYVFRTLVEDSIPLNEGCLKPLEIIAPAGSMLNPAPGAAVVAGNVETSMAIVDALYGALGVLAASQGTMNNFTFGDDARQYYETLCGGAGAGPDFDGASAVHTHMTNSRLTDPEILEQRFPVLVERFAIRKGSGGAGAHKGGDGVVRKIRFRAPMQAAILSSRRSTAPFGLNGAESAKPGENFVERADGRLERLSATDEAQMHEDDAFIIETPGGGGFGPLAR
ncbi:MAG: hydantoinase B/oxoprolinase family protein [Hyphomonadaceae bacterium]